MHQSSTARRSLLENDEVVAYLHDLDPLEDFASENSTHPTDTTEFRSEVVALSQGMYEHDAAGAPADLPRYRTFREPSPVHVDEEPYDASDSGAPDRPSPVPFPVMVLFLVGMSLLGASSAAVVFHDRLLQILGW